MKQRIMPEQLQELTEEQKEKLREWWKPKVGDFFYYDNEERIILHKNRYGAWSHIVGCDTYDFPKREVENGCPLLDIGQMIELLQEQGGFESRYGTEPALVTEAPTYVIIDWNKEEYPELADALWEAVKLIL